MPPLRRCALTRRRSSKPKKTPTPRFHYTPLPASQYAPLRHRMAPFHNPHIMLSRTSRTTSTLTPAVDVREHLLPPRPTSPAALGPRPHSTRRGYLTHRNIEFSSVKDPSIAPAHTRVYIHIRSQSATVLSLTSICVLKRAPGETGVGIPVRLRPRGLAFVSDPSKIAPRGVDF